MTSDQKYAGSDEDFILEVTYKVGLAKQGTAIYFLYNRPGNDMESDNGDTWYLKQTGACIKPEDVVSLEIKPEAGGVNTFYDGWNIN